MKQTLFVAALMAAFAAHAADTPGSNPSTPTAAERLANARAALAANDYTKAQRELNAGLREDSKNADLHNLMGYSYRKRPSPDLTKAYEHYYIALRLDPNHKGAHSYIGQAYLMEKRLPQAEEHLAAVEKACGGQTCPEYQELFKAIADYKATAK